MAEVVLMKFTKRTYRRARYLSLKELDQAKGLYIRSQFGTVSDDDATDYYLACLKKSYGIIQRGRREKKLWL